MNEKEIRKMEEERNKREGRKSVGEERKGKGDDIKWELGRNKGEEEKKRDPL